MANNGRERRVAREEHGGDDDGGDDDDEGSAAREENVKSDDDGWVLTRHRSRKNAMVERGPGAGEVGKAVDARDEGFGERFETVDDDAFR